MSDEKLKQKIKELENELRQKNAEVLSYRSQISRTNAELEKVIASISHEVQMAAQIQRILSPTEIPSIQGFDFSTKFLPGTGSGGDYFDIFEHEDKMKFGVILSSSSGHTMSALFLSVLIKISSQIEARRGLEPHQMINKLVKEIVPQAQAMDKSSLFYGVIDKRSYDLKYCSVGNIQSYLQVYGQDALTAMEPCGPKISRDFNTELRSLTVQLNPRDRWCLCTEGVTQSTNPENEIFGEERLRDTIRSAPKVGAHELRNEILYKTEKFTGRADPVRDCTVLVIEVKDRVIKLARQ